MVMELRAKIFELEREFERKDEQTSQNSTGIASQKRKRVPSELGESAQSRVSKQARTATSARSALTENPSFHLSAEERESLAQDTQSKRLLGMQREPDADILATTLLQNIYLLQRIRSRKSPQAQEIASVLSQISININRMTSIVTQPAMQASPSKLNMRNSTTRAQERTVMEAQTATDYKLDCKILATGRIFHWVLKSVNLLEHTQAGKALQGQVVYNYVTLFRDLLERICDLAAFHYKDKPSKDPQSRKNNRVQVGTRGPEASRPSVVSDISIIRLCRLLITMVLSLDPSTRIQKDILDGFHFFLLAHVGQLLSFCVFRDHPIPITAIQTTNINIANPPPTTPQGSTTNIPEQHESILHHQAPYLIYILTHLAPLTADTSPSAIVRSAREKLQYTLLNSVFGEQAQEFVDALTKPANPDIDPKEDVLAEGTDEDMGDWYKNEVWKLVGWDVLIKHIQWPEEGVMPRI